jgi:hypothetical protein
MTSVIYKYDLIAAKLERQVIQLPRGARPLSVAFQMQDFEIGIRNPVLRVWAQVDPEMIARHPTDYTTPYTFLVVATGSPGQIDGLEFLGRADVNGLVFHVFYAPGDVR